MPLLRTMSVLADFLRDGSGTPSRGDPAEDSERSGARRRSLDASPILTVEDDSNSAERQALRPTRFTPGPALQGAASPPPHLRPILKKAVTCVLPLPGSTEPTGASVISDGQTTAEPSPVRSSKRLRFATEVARPFAEFGAPLQPLPDVATSSLLPHAQRTVDKYRDDVTRLLGAQSPLVDRRHFHHIAPAVKLTRANPSEALGPLVRKPFDPLLEGQVALLDYKVQQQLRMCESVLGINLKEVTDQRKTKEEQVVSHLADKLVKEVHDQRWKQHLADKEAAARKQHQESLRSVTVLSSSSVTSPTKPRRFVAGGVIHAERKCLTGKELVVQHREQRQAQAELERIQKDPETKRQMRLLTALEDVARKADMYRSIVAEQEEERAERERGRAGSKMTTVELINDWRAAVEDTIEDDDMEEARDKARALRKALRVEREEHRKMQELLSGLTSIQLEEKKKREEETKKEPAKKRWRITKMGSVDVFSIPRWSSRPVETLRGDVVVEELDCAVVDNVTWILTSTGWIPCQVSFGGMSRTQLFAEAPQDAGSGVVAAMLDELDDAYERIVDAMTLCPPEQLKSQAEVKEMLKHMEFTRHTVRDLPGGRRDMIRRIWDDMQRSKSGAAQAVAARRHNDDDDE